MSVTVIDKDIEKVIERIKIINAILGMVATGAGSFISWKASLDIFIGWFLMAANLEVLGWQLKRMFNRKDSAKSNTVYSVVTKCYLKFIALALVIWALIRSGFVNPVALSVGLFVFGLSFIGVVGEIFIKMVLRRGV